MATVSKSGVPSLSTPNPSDNSRLGPFMPGEDLVAGDACYIKSDGKVWRSIAAAANAAAEVDGFCVEGITLACRQPVTLYNNVTLRYGSGLTPGARYFLSAGSAGQLDTATSTYATKHVAVVLPDGERIRVNGTL